MSKPSERRIVLTPREQQVLNLTASGLGESKIAFRLGIGKERVDTIRDQIKDKIDLPKGQDTVAMVAKAQKLGLLPGPNNR
jgi:DNA-binding CsgD family transcriptional regulator